MAFGGHGIVFFDECDSDDDRRYTIAHEVAHFLDYWSLWQDITERFGSSIVEVLDGIRSPSPNERIRAVLARIPIGAWTDLMERSASGGWSEAVEASEKVADEVALALLAPAREVIKKARLKPSSSYAVRKDRVCGLLRYHFGLPAHLAKAYGPLILSRAGFGYSWVENIRRSTL